MREADCPYQSATGLIPRRRSAPPQGAMVSVAWVVAKPIMSRGRARVPTQWVGEVGRANGRPATGDSAVLPEQVGPKTTSTGGRTAAGAVKRRLLPVSFTLRPTRPGCAAMVMPWR
jgi:hypothetical protein